MLRVWQGCSGLCPQAHQGLERHSLASVGETPWKHLVNPTSERSSARCLTGPSRGARELGIRIEEGPGRRPWDSSRACLCEGEAEIADFCQSWRRITPGALSLPWKKWDGLRLSGRQQLTHFYCRRT